MRLLDAKNLSGLGLCDATLPDEAVDLECQLSLEQLLFGMRQAEIGKKIAPASGGPGPIRSFFVSVNFLSVHISFAPVDAAVPLQPNVDGSDRFPSSAWKCRASISSEMHAEHKPLPHSGPCKPRARCLLDGRKRSRTPLLPQIHAEVSPQGQFHPIAPRKAPAPRRDEPLRGKYEDPEGSKQSKPQDVAIIALYINMSIDINRSRRNRWIFC
jgi:hypothetical protein